MTLVEWLRSALDERERIARAVAAGFGLEMSNVVGIDLAAYLDANDPEHALRTVQAHREILDRHAPVGRTVILCTHCGDGPPPADSWPCPDVRSLAAIYQDQTPGFDPSWIEERS